MICHNCPETASKKVCTKIGSLALSCIKWRYTKISTRIGHCMEHKVGQFFNKKKRTKRKRCWLSILLRKFDPGNS